MNQLSTLRKTTAWSLPLILTLVIATPVFAAPSSQGPMGIVDQIVQTALAWWTDTVDALGYGQVIAADESGTTTTTGSGDDGGTGTSRDPIGGSGGGDGY